ncbi:DNA/RNA non-specific endonuclease domain-containing protein [Phthorimaea operculella]|nr:DNA/RNA non-specific endonuclease domain-containing protein [Phthorimaea operculella]
MWTATVLLALALSVQAFYIDDISDKVNQEKWIGESTLRGEVTRSGHRSVRAVTDLFFERDQKLDNILQRQATEATKTTLRREVPKIIIADPNPIMSYTMYDKLGNVKLPLNIEALITTHTLSKTYNAFDSDANNNYAQMDRNSNTPNQDERGHILASRLGGPGKEYNLFPQPWKANRGRGSMWYKLESDMDKFVRGNPNRFIRFWAAMSYGTDNNQLKPRPTGVMIRIRAYDNKKLVDLHTGEQLVRTSDNMYEDVYFSNDAEHTVQPLPAKPRKS